MEEASNPMPLVPPWLERLLSTEFFAVCRAHCAAAKSECNMYCLDCNGGDAFCFYCRSSKHEDHRVIQIRRSSYHDVVRVSEVQKILDISGLQTYVINGARVLFLNERPQPKTVKAVSHNCEICGRGLLDPFRFCSLGCKVIGIKRNGDASFIIDASNVIEIEGGEKELSSTTTSQSSEEKQCSLRSLSRARKRKGIPHRSPLL